MTLRRLSFVIFLFLFIAASSHAFVENASLQDDSLFPSEWTEETDEEERKADEFEFHMEKEVEAYSLDELTEQNIPWWEKEHIVKKGKRLL